MSFEKHPRLRLPLLAFYGGIVLALAMAVLPHSLHPFDPLSDKLQHFVAFVILALLARAAHPNTPRLIILLSLASFGAVIEFVQGIHLIGRHPDVLDWLADVAGIGAALLIVALFEKACAVTRSVSHWR